VQDRARTGGVGVLAVITETAASGVAESTADFLAVLVRSAHSEFGLCAGEEAREISRETNDGGQKAHKRSFSQWRQPHTAGNTKHEATGGSQRGSAQSEVEQGRGTTLDHKNGLIRC
jgi:hypothetical protein